MGLIPDMTGYTTPSGTASASSEASTWYAWKAFDKDATGNNIWGASSTTGWLAYDTGGALWNVTSYDITAESVTSGAWPSSWTFEGWNGSSWVTLDTRTSESFTLGQTRNFAFANSNSYQKHRLNVTANGGNGTYLFVAELDFNGVVTSTGKSLFFCHG